MERFLFQFKIKGFLNYLFEVLILLEPEFYFGFEIK
jgi:hypothetical protein